MPTGPCAASRLGTVAASAVCGQPCVHPHESELSASVPMFVRAWRIANAQKKIGNISVPDFTAEDGT